MRANSITDLFFSRAIETAIVTRDHWRTREGLWPLGIVFWRVYTFNPQNTTNQTYYGKLVPFVLAICFAEAGSLTWKLMEFISGSAIFADLQTTRRRSSHTALRKALVTHPN